MATEREKMLAGGLYDPLDAELGPGVQILTPLHPLDPVLRRSQEYAKPIEIGSEVWVGGGALILAGVRIGDRTVIGAGSVVTHDIPDGVLAAGNPCRVIRAVAEGDGVRT